jgi:hypothetical protein
VEVEGWPVGNWLKLMAAAACLLVLTGIGVSSREGRRPGAWRRKRSYGKTIDTAAGIAGVLGGLFALAFFVWLCL